MRTDYHAQQHAIVIGASVGGLLAARVLADYYGQVTILERDHFPVIGQHRKGVPQSRHAHALLPLGREVMEELFPGLCQELVAQGAILADGLLHGIRTVFGSYHCRFTSNLQNLYVSRPRLEGQMRARLLALPNVLALENCHVLALTASADQSRVTGVRLIQRDLGNSEATMAADLVVDATGRGSHSPVWLEALGYGQPAIEEVKVDVGYASRLYRRQPGQAQGAYSIILTPVPPNRRMAAMIAMEDDLWQVTLAGFLGDHPPTDPEGFLAFAKGLPAPDIYAELCHAEPLTHPVPVRFPVSTRHYYEKMKRFPAGYLVFGDAIASFNPTYGQGMTVAAMEAMTLQRCLAASADELAQRFFAEASKVVDIPWTITTGGDLRFPEIAGKRSPLKKMIDWYMVRFHCAAQNDPALVLAFSHVASLRAAPKVLLHPRLAWRVLLGNWRFPGQRSAALWLKPVTVHS